MREINLSTDVVTNNKEIGDIYVANISRSADGNLLFISEQGLSTLELYTYDAVNNKFSSPKQTDGYYLTTAVNRDGSLIALRSRSGISIIDRNFQAVKNLSADGAIAFDPTKEIFYAASSTSDQVIAYSTKTWRELYRLSVGEDVSSLTSADINTMSVSNDGKFLFLSTPTGVRILSLNSVVV